MFQAAGLNRTENESFEAFLRQIQIFKCANSFKNWQKQIFKCVNSLEIGNQVQNRHK